MNSRFARRITTISFFALLFSIQLAAQNQGNYIITNLGTLGGTFSSAAALTAMASASVMRMRKRCMAVKNAVQNRARKQAAGLR